MSDPLPEPAATGAEDFWLQRLAAGDNQAVARFWEDYGDRLLRLADAHLAARLKPRVGPEDVVQSACRTFLRRAHQGQFKLVDSIDLWRLICAITLAKVHQHARFHLAKKRAVGREQAIEPDTGDSQPLPGEIPSPGFTPCEAAEFADLLEQLLASLDGEERQMVDLKLQDHSNAEIADRLECSERTVRRILARVHAKFQRTLRNEEG